MATDELGALHEETESVENQLRKKLLEQDREMDKLREQIVSLQDQLAQRPPLDVIQALQREHKSNEIILQGTQRENEKCMAELERAKSREKWYESKLREHVGESWQSLLEMPASLGNGPRSGILGHQRSNTISSPISHHGLGMRQHSPSPSLRGDPDSTIIFGHGRARNSSFDSSHNASFFSDKTSSAPSLTRAEVEEIKMLVLGMEKRANTREQIVQKSLEHAEAEARRFDSLKVQVTSEST
ncbi:hypothetical protein CVT24_012683 [Panaeolus cyanescens]|uniref:Uncharacterized protein n=1 Tax=Panaeolus cyanescens TaxID=181874 RepID=A0A409YK89_9AGAR|nr:hypothetical protein CVT24_012683 [Panaeolus cyanescens]